MISKVESLILGLVRKFAGKPTRYPTRQAAIEAQIDKAALSFLENNPPNNVTIAEIKTKVGILIEPENGKNRNR